MLKIKKKVGIIIHSFAAAHALTAGLLAQTMIGDTAVLTILTVSMIIAIAKACGKQWTVGKAFAQIGVYLGGVLGGYGAMFLIKWIPGIGNFANAITTTVITETLGWATYLVCINNMLDPSTMTKKQKEEITKKAKTMREQEKDNIKQDYDAMSDEDKSRMKEITKELRKLSIDEKNPDPRTVQKINELSDEMNNILSKYCQDDS